MTWDQIYEYSNELGYDPGRASKLKHKAKDWIRAAEEFKAGHGRTGNSKQRAPSGTEAAIIDMNWYLRRMQRGSKEGDIMVSWDVN